MSAPADVKMVVNQTDLDLSWKAVDSTAIYRVSIAVNGTEAYTNDVVSPGPDFWLIRHDIYDFESAVLGMVDEAAVYRMKASITAIDKDTDQPGPPGDGSLDYVKRTKIIGTDYGDYFDDVFDAAQVHAHKPAIVGIKALYVYHGGVVDAMQALYKLEGGRTFLGPRHGGRGGTKDTIKLEDGEEITEVHVTTDYKVINQLKFITNAGVEYGPYGKAGDDMKSAEIQGRVIALNGRSGSSIRAIGFYIYL